MADHLVTVLVVVASTGLLVLVGTGIAASIRNRRKNGEPEHEQTSAEQAWQGIADSAPS